jgi:hypothetical protein
MRLIDAEPLKELFPDNGEGSWTYNATAKAYIDAQPTIEPDIIRCKDCKHWNPQLKTANGNGLGSCDFHNVALVTSEGFCYWAERGEQNDSEAD